MGAALLAALKALPELVAVVRQLGESIKYAQELAIDNKYNKLKEETRALVKSIEEADSNERRQDLVRELNRLITDSV